MFLHVIKAEYLRGYALLLLFNDGTSGEIDLEPYLVGEVFEPLRDINAFRQFRVDIELQTLVWENGADLAPEFLRENLDLLSKNIEAAR